MNNSEVDVALKKNFCLVYLVIGDETIGLFENSIKSLRATLLGIDCIVFHDANSRNKMEVLACKYGFESICLSEKDVGFNNYSEYGTSDFNKITSQKWNILLRVFERGYDKVVFLDCDVVIIRDFLPYLSGVSNIYNVAIQSESQAIWLPLFCTGFMLFSKRAIPFLGYIAKINSVNSIEMNDQDVFNKIVRSKPLLIKEILMLPDSLFPNRLLKYSRCQSGPVAPLRYLPDFLFAF